MSPAGLTVKVCPALNAFSSRFRILRPSSVSGRKAVRGKPIAIKGFPINFQTLIVLYLKFDHKSANKNGKMFEQTNVYTWMWMLTILYSILEVVGYLDTVIILTKKNYCII